MKSAFTKSALALVGLGLIGSVGCSTWKKGETVSQPTAPSPAAVEAASDVQASKVAEVRFDKNSYTLNESARESLTKTIQDARQNGSIDDIKVVAWSDKEYPTTEQKKLSKHDRDLAEKRADSIKNFIKTSLNESDIQTYNMAKRPNSLSELFNTADNRVKTAMQDAGIPQTSSNSVDTAVSGKASSAVVMVIMK